MAPTHVFCWPTILQLPGGGGFVQTHAKLDDLYAEPPVDPPKPKGAGHEHSAPGHLCAHDAALVQPEGHGTDVPAPEAVGAWGAPGADRRRPQGTPPAGGAGAQRGDPLVARGVKGGWYWSEEPHKVDRHPQKSLLDGKFVLYDHKASLSIERAYQRCEKHKA